MIRVLTFVAMFMALGAARASAQPPVAGRIEAGGGLVWLGSASTGSRDATESTASGGTSAIFTTAGRVAGAPGVRVHAAFRVTDRIELEAVGSRTRPAFEVNVSGDIEQAAPVTARETLTQYLVGGGVLWYVPLHQMSGRLRPFVAGHAAYLRQLHESDTLAVAGQSYQLGGGVKYIVPRQAKSLLKGYGVRADVGVAARRKGVFFESSARFSPVLGVELIVRF
jgi:hypothetical protein